MKELVEAIKNDTLYDFIANEGYKYEKYDLILILKEVIFATYELGQDVYNKMLNKLLENLGEIMEEADE